MYSFIHPFTEQSRDDTTPLNNVCKERFQCAHRKRTSMKITVPNLMNGSVLYERRWGVWCVNLASCLFLFNFYLLPPRCGLNYFASSWPHCDSSILAKFFLSLEDSVMRVEVRLHSSKYVQCWLVKTNKWWHKYFCKGLIKCFDRLAQQRHGNDDNV